MTFADPARKNTLYVHSFTPEEKSLHRNFVGPCLRTEGWETVSTQYMAMKADAVKRELRPCTFSQFLGVVRSFRNYSFSHRPLQDRGFSSSRGPNTEILSLTADWRWTSRLDR